MARFFTIGEDRGLKGEKEKQGETGAPKKVGGRSIKKRKKKGGGGRETQ